MWRSTAPASCRRPSAPARRQHAVYDHAAVIANELRTLAYTPCDRHLRHLAAANINLFVGGFMAPRTPVNTAAPADTAFWRRPETSMVRRAVVQLAEKGALAPTISASTPPPRRAAFSRACRPV